MKRLTRQLIWLALAATLGTSAFAFSLLGPFKNGQNGVTEGWQAAGFTGLPLGLGYTLGGDIGGPMFGHEFYRWNVPTIYYAFDESFIKFFGTNGVAAVDRAFEILNAVPAASKMTADLAEFPLDSRGVNNTAQSLGFNDVKSTVLGLLMEEVGLANPERFVWGLRGRVPTPLPTRYSVVQMNYDPLTLAPSAFVNGVLYSFRIEEPVGIPAWASALEISNPDPETRKYTSVAGSSPNPDAAYITVGDTILFTDPLLSAGHFLRGLTRDDAGGLRYLLNPRNIVTESLLTNVVLVTNISPWTIVLGTNIVVSTNVFSIPGVATGTNATNNLRNGLRGGMDKMTFRRVAYDSLLGSEFTDPVTNRYTDVVTTNGRAFIQTVQRVIQQPDILFTAQDLGMHPILSTPFTTSRTTTAGWVNNNVINGRATQNGPGLITPPIVISLTDNAPFYGPLGVFAVGPDQLVPFVWASFDGSTNAPIVYPAFLNYTPETIAQQVFGPSPDFP